MHWGDAPTWTAAIGTVGALFAALWQIGAERRRRAQREHRSQAERLSAWVSADQTGTDTPVVVLNRSDEPVYNVVATLVIVLGAGPHVGEAVADPGYRVVMTILPPGRWRTHVRSGWGGMMRQPGIELAFTDRRGTHWVRRADGLVEEIPEGAPTYYKLDTPYATALPAVD